MLRRPWLTLTVFGVTAATTTIGLLDGAVTQTLVRDPAVFDGDWWRLLSPILINPEGWPQVLSNLVALLIFGTVAESVFGRVRWVALYLVGAFAGELFSYATHNYSAGSSVAIMGLLGGLSAWMLSGRSGVPVRHRIAAGLLPVGAVLLIVIGDEHGAPLLAGAAVGGLFLTVHTTPTANDLRSEPNPTARPND